MKLASRHQQVGLFLLCFVSGLLFHYLFYRKGIGVSYPIFMMVLYVIYFMKLHMSIKGQSAFEWMLWVCVVLLSMAMILFSNTPLTILNLLIIPAFFLAHTTSHARFYYNDWKGYQFILSIFSVVADACHYFLRSFKIGGKAVKARLNEKNYQILKQIAFGILISAPLLFVVIILLSSADRQFEQLLLRFPTLLMELDVGNTLFQLLLILGVTFIIFTYMLALSKPLHVPKNPLEQVPRSIDSLIIITVLVLVNIVYCLFIYVQFSYFFSGNPASTSATYTFAEYARRGFVELTLVTVINFSLLLIVINFTKRSSKRAKGTIRILNTCLVTFTVIMLVSAFHRLSLYEQAYGYTEARIFAHAFMIFLFIVLVFAYLKVWFKSINLSKVFIIIAVLSYTTLNYIQVDQLIVKQNLMRYEETGKIDTDYLKLLSYDAVPILVDYVSKNSDKREEFSEVLEEYKTRLLEEESHWQAWNIAEYNAKNKLLD